MTAVQNNLYQYILNTITNRDENYRGKGLITDYTCLRKVSTNIFSYTIHRHTRTYTDLCIFLIYILDLDTSQSFGRCLEECS